MLEAIEARVLAKIPDGPNRDNFIGAVRAVLYRYRGSTQYADEYLATLLANDTNENRYTQEKSLLGFFVSGLAALESFYFGAYFIGAVLQPTVFTSTARPRRITPAETVRVFQGAFVGDPFSVTLAAITSALQFSEWSELRNFLAHRVSPSREVNLTSFVSLRRRKPSGSTSRVDVWKTPVPSMLDANLTTSRLTWLTDQLVGLTQAADQFTLKHF